MTTCIRIQLVCSAIQRSGAAVRSPAKARLWAFLALVLLTFAIGTALALSCVDPELLVFPPRGDIPPNPIFVLQGDGATGEFVRGLTADSFDFSFIGGHSRARIVERGDGVSSYIIVAPVKPLREGPLDLRLHRSFDGRPAEWTHVGTFKVQGLPDETVPTLQRQADRATARFQDLALWGTSIVVDLPVTADESPVFWLATIDSSEAGSPLGRPVTMFLPAGGATLSTGPCGGNYPLEHGKQYLVDLTPIDAAGHRGKGTAPSILVDIP